MENEKKKITVLLSTFDIDS